MEVIKKQSCLNFLLGLALVAPLTASATSITVDFEADLNGNSLEAGDVISSNLDAAVTVSTDTAFPAIIFDSANPTGGDRDLRTGTEGNILILSEDGDLSDPDDAASGGSFIFAFNQAVQFESITLVDIEEDGGVATGITEAGAEIELFFIPGIGNNSIQTIDNPSAGTALTQVQVTLEGSGAISEFAFSAAPGNPVNPGNPGNPGTEVPEPSTYALLLVSTLGLLARKRYNS